jgi:hypothetical protein
MVLTAFHDAVGRAGVTEMWHLPCPLAYFFPLLRLA